MALVTISSKKPSSLVMPVLRLGFRPFFICAAAFSVFVMGLWGLVYSGVLPLPFRTLAPFEWHSHEMIFGYSLAVVAGFLLTAVQNWTGVPTVRGARLAVIFSTWLCSRICFVFGDALLIAAAVMELVFTTMLCVAVASPIVESRQWSQLGILSKLIFLAVANASFYGGAFGFVTDGARLGPLAGLYLLVALVLTIGFRVMPSYVEIAVGGNSRIRVPGWSGAATLVLFIAFFVNELFLGNRLVLQATTSALFGVTLFRLARLHHRGIWTRPLLWSLFLAIAAIDSGFLLLACSTYFDISRSLALHAFAVGGIGMSTIGMMTRVTLGHTGRDVLAPPRFTGLACALVATAAFVRVVLPLLSMSLYTVWIATSQALWILAFSLFLWIFGPMLCTARADGQDG